MAQKEAKPKIPVTVLLSRIRREIAYLKGALRDDGVAIPKRLSDLLASQLPKSVDAKDRRRLGLARQQERELRVLRDKTCPRLGSFWRTKAAGFSKRRGAGSGVSKVYDSVERSGFPVVGGMIES